MPGRICLRRPTSLFSNTLVYSRNTSRISALASAAAGLGGGDISGALGEAATSGGAGGGLGGADTSGAFGDATTSRDVGGADEPGGAAGASGPGEAEGGRGTALAKRSPAAANMVAASSKTLAWYRSSPSFWRFCAWA